MPIMTARSPIRVLLADDSPTIRHHLASLINETPGIEVIGEAKNGEMALALVKELRPDVVSMDIRMPGMDGLAATRRIMTECPTPVVVVSSMVESDLELSFQALESGALAVVPKPPDRHDPSFREKQRQLVKTLVAMAGVRVIARRQRFEPGTPSDGYIQSNGRELRRGRPLELVVIGASAGGPSALTTLLGTLPASFPLPVVVVQHMPHEFLPGLVRWLDKSTRLAVEMAADGDVLKPGVVHLSPGMMHTLVERQGEVLVARLLREQGTSYYQPSVNALFYSAASVCGPATAAIILTGMGDDGADGLLAIRQAGGRTFAQNQASSTVFGMPAAAIERGAAEYVLPLAGIATTLMQLMQAS